MTASKTKKFAAKDKKSDAHDFVTAKWQFDKKEMACQRSLRPSSPRRRRAAGASVVTAACDGANTAVKARAGSARQVIIETHAHQHENGGLAVHYRLVKKGEPVAEPLAWGQVEETHSKKRRRGPCTMVSEPMPMAAIQDDQGRGLDIELFSSRKFVVGEYSAGATSPAGSEQDISFIGSYYATERQFTRISSQDEDDPETEKKTWKEWCKSDIDVREGKPMHDPQFRDHHIRIWYSPSNNDEITRIAINGVTYYCNEPFLLED